MAQAKTGLLDPSLDAAIPMDFGRQLAEKFVSEEGPRFHEAYSIANDLNDQRAKPKEDKFKLYVPESHNCFPQSF